METEFLEYNLFSKRSINNSHHHSNCPCGEGRETLLSNSGNTNILSITPDMKAKTLSFSPLVRQHPAGHRTMRSCLHVPDASHPSSHFESDTNTRLKPARAGRSSSAGSLFYFGARGLFELNLSLLPKSPTHKRAPGKELPGSGEQLARSSFRAALTGLGKAFP